MELIALSDDEKGRLVTLGAFTAPSRFANLGTCFERCMFDPPETSCYQALSTNEP